MKTTIILLPLIIWSAFSATAQTVMVTTKVSLVLYKLEYQQGYPPESEAQRSLYRNHAQYAMKYDASVINPYVEPKTVSQIQAENEVKTKALFDFRTEQAQKELPTAQFNLGMMYLNGQGTATNTVLGMKYIQRSATNGNAEAIGYLKKAK